MDMEKASEKANLIAQHSTNNAFGLKLKNFVYGEAFVLAMAIISAFSYVSQQNVEFLLFFSLVGSAMLILLKDLTPLLPVLFCAIFSVSKLEYFDNLSVLFVFAPLVLSLIARIFIHPVKNRKIGFLTVPLLLYFSALVLGGIRTADYLPFIKDIHSPLYGEYLALVLGVGLGVPLEYAVLKNNLRFENAPERFNPKTYFAFVLTVTGLLVGTELFYEKVLLNNPFPRMGWGNVNLSAYILLLAIPACWYLLVSRKSAIKTVFIALALFLLYYFVFLTGSDGCLDLSIAFFVVLTIFTFTQVKKKNRLLYSNIVLSAVLVLSIAIIALKITNEELFFQLFEKMLSNTGRDALYDIAFEVFEKEKIFGAGIFYPLLYPPVGQHNFHSSFIHILATCGIYGIVCFLIYFFARIAVLIRKFDAFNFYMLISFLCYEIYAAVDTGEFVFTVMIAVAIVAFVEKTDSSKRNDETLPLSAKGKLSIY